MSTVPSDRTLPFARTYDESIVPPLSRLSLASDDPTSWSHYAQFVGKRIIDFVGAALGLVVLSPLLLLIAVAIRLDSRGPIFFRQQRLGLGRQPFLMWKFRTMVVDAEKHLTELERCNESEGGVLFKMKQDLRVTRIGQFLRRTSLDELPQLFNVLQGHMSLVGPRPLPLRDCARLEQVDVTNFHRRLTVLPGLTGPWQVSGRSEVGFDRMIHFDMDYLESWSLWFDLRIIFQTILVVLTNKGAY